MSDAEVLAHEIEALMAIQRDAWRELARPTLTTFDRREIRNRIRQADADLRDLLEIRTERLRCRPRPVNPAGNSLARLEFRFFWPRLAYGNDEIGSKGNRGEAMHPLSLGAGGGWHQSDLPGRDPGEN
jgi:hypothetical protein